MLKRLKKFTFELWIRVVYGKGASRRRQWFLRGEQVALSKVSDQLQAVETLHADQTQKFTIITQRHIERSSKQFEEVLTTNNESQHKERKVWMQTLLTERAELINDHLKEKEDLKKSHAEELALLKSDFQTKEKTRADEHAELIKKTHAAFAEVEELKSTWDKRVKEAGETLHKIDLMLQTIAAKKGDVLRRLAELVALDPDVDKLSEELELVKKAMRTHSLSEHQQLNKASAHIRLVQ